MAEKKKYTKVKGKKDTYSYKTKASPLDAFGIVRFAKAITGQRVGPTTKTVKVDGYTGATKKAPTKVKATKKTVKKPKTESKYNILRAPAPRKHKKSPKKK